MGNPLIRFNPTRAPTTPMKAGGGMKPPGEAMEKGLGGAHFMNPTYIQAGHNTNGKMKLGKHPGFAALVKSGVPAGALANASRNASPAAKKRNPRLKRVK